MAAAAAKGTTNEKVLPRFGVLSTRRTPPHQLHQLFADAQPEACAAVFAGRRGIDLGEALKNTLELVGRNADARVGDRKAQCTGRGQVRLDPERHLAALRKLDRVAQQIHQHLAQTRRVAGHPGRHIRMDERHQFELLGIGADGHQFRRLIHEVLKVEGRRFQLQIARFDFGNVQNVVDQLQ